MNSLHKFQKYIIFLKPIYFKKTFIISIYNKIKTNLENKGIVLYNIDHQMNGYTLHNKKLMFDAFIIHKSPTTHNTKEQKITEKQFIACYLCIIK